MELNDLQQQRLAKLETLREHGHNPFPPRSNRTHRIAAVLTGFDALEQDGTVLTVAGRIVGARRIMGKLAFAHITDGSGHLQLWVSKADAGDEAFARFRDMLDTFDIVEVRGTLRRTQKGESSIVVQHLTVLAKALNPPPEKWSGLTDVEERHRQRYLDLIVNEERRAIFRARATVVTAMRRYLDDAGFVEVETPTLQPIYGGAAARPFTTFHNQLKQDLYLRIASELYLKRLIVAGFEGVYEIGKDFRNEGVDRSHNPEFTMMECYQAYANYEDMMRLVEEMFRAIAVAVHGSPQVPYQGQTLDFAPAWARRSYADAIRETTGVDIRAARTLPDLHAAIATAGVKVEHKPTWGKQVDELFSEFVEPTLQQPTFVLDYPVELSPFAQRKPDDPDYTERFEGYVAGMEIANAFSELNDPLDQEHRFIEQGRAYDAGDDEAHQMDRDYINALMYAMPPTGGLGVGVDRLAMIMTDQTTIREVIFFPHLRSRDTAAPDSAS